MALFFVARHSNDVAIRRSSCLDKRHSWQLQRALP
jgi:hypothetical protein